MAAQQIVVRVINGASETETQVRRPVRLTPDGSAGIVYAGAVYPVLSGDVVDIAGPSWEVEDCNRFLLAGAKVPYAPQTSNAPPRPEFLGFHGEWNVETSGFGHYVVFNGSERLASDVVNALESAGVAVQRWDVSHRPASDGKFYDWFARLRLKTTHDDAVARVSAVFAPAPASVEAPPAPTATPYEDLAAKVEQLLDLTVELTGRLSQSDREVALLRRKLAAVTDHETKLLGDLDRSLAYQKSLHDQISTLGRPQEQDADAHAYLIRQADNEELLEMALSENSELLSSVMNFRNQADARDSRILNLEAVVAALEGRLEELGQQDRERRRAGAARGAPRRGVSGFLDNAFARLTFVLESVEVLANLDAPASILRALTQIDMGDLLGKDLEGMRGWREVSKLATGIAGSEDMGRIYYKPDGSEVLVSVHIKQDEKEQRRHIDRLRSV